MKKQLRAFETMQREPGVLAKFTENYLRRDGLFLLRLIGNNIGEVSSAGGAKRTDMGLGADANSCQNARAH